MALKPYRDIYPFSLQLAAVDDHVAKVDADPELHLRSVRRICVLTIDLLLNIRCASNRFYGAAEFRKYTVSGASEGPPAMAFNQLVYRYTILLNLFERGLFGLIDVTTVSYHVGGENGG